MFSCLAKIRYPAAQSEFLRETENIWKMVTIYYRKIGFF